MSRLNSFLLDNQNNPKRLGHGFSNAADMLGFSGENEADSGSRGPLKAPPSINFPHRIFVPEHYEAGYQYPLVIWLHSQHSSECELDEIMPNLSMRNFVGLSLRATRPSRKSPRLFRWGSTLTEYILAEECIFQAIEQLSASLSINAKNIFVAGFGSGATLAQWIGLRNPNTFAGVVACNGPFPNHKRALADWKSARNLPILAMQNSDSNTCGIDQVIDMMRLAHRTHLNYQFMQFQTNSSTLPNHEAKQQTVREGTLDTEMLQVANRFMMGIVTSTPITLQPNESLSRASASTESRFASDFNCRRPTTGN
jgi:phospholipase/carboxylesterase